MVKPTPAEVDKQIGRIVASPQFCEAPRLQTFLRFVVALSLEGKADQIKEATIAAEVFGRADTSDDSIVRSAARRLRAKLQEYYEQSGARDPLRIFIAKGGYVPEISVVSQPPSPGAAADEDTPDPAHGVVSQRLLWVPALIAVFAVFCVLALPWRNRVSTASHAAVEAEQLYLKGRYHWSKRTPENLNRAVDDFTQAVSKNPTDAKAYVGLADSYNLLSEYTMMPYQEAFHRAAAAAQTAIKLDDSLAEAHNSLAFASFYGAWDEATAEREFRRALQLNPNYITAHHWYATLLMSIGRASEAMAEIDRAQELDPSSQAILADKGWILLQGGSGDEAKRLLEEVEMSDPNFLSPHRYLAATYLSEKDFPRYLGEQRRVATLLGDPTELAIVEAGENGFAHGGPVKMLQSMLSAQEHAPGLYANRYYELAQMCALLGEKRRALEYLHLALGRHDVNLVVLTVDQTFIRMRQDPAFANIVSCVGVARPIP